MTLSCSYLSRRLTPMKTSLTCRIHWVLLLAGWLLTFCASIVLIVLLSLRPQLNQIHNPVLLFNNGTSVSPAVSARNLRIIFDSYLTFEDQISSLSRECFYHICDLRRIRSVINFNTAKTIGTSFVHSRLDFCNFCAMVFQKLNWFAFNTSRTLLPVLLLLLLDHPTLTSFLNLFIG